MKIYKVRRLYGDIVSIRIYKPLVRFLEEQSWICIQVGDEKMKLSSKEVKKRAFQTNKMPILSRFTGKPYWLVDFKWTPSIDKRFINNTVKKVVKEYDETLNMLGNQQLDLWT